MTKYHLYLEFWSKEENKSNINLVIEREFEKESEMKETIEEFRKILCGD